MVRLRIDSETGNSSMGLRFRIVASASTVSRILNMSVIPFVDPNRWRYSWYVALCIVLQRKTPNLGGPSVKIVITNVKAILTAPAGIGLCVVKVETSEPGLYGVGCATFTQRLGPVESAVNDHLRPLLIGRDVDQIEDIWHLCYQNSYWRNSPVLNNAISGVDAALWDIKGKQE